MFGRNFMSKPSGTAVKMPDGSIFLFRTHFCRVNDAGRALDLRPACQNLGVPTPK